MQERWVETATQQWRAFTRSWLSALGTTFDVPLFYDMLSDRKVGVLTFHRSINYGSYWQARCIVEGLRTRGYDAELLDHECGRIRRRELSCALQPELPQRTPRALLKDYAAKARRFAVAVGSLPLSRRFSIHEPQRGGEYDAIVVGSDEVWNFHHPWFGSKPIFFGDGLKAEKLVSYAASFGNHSAWHGIHPQWARKLDRFSSISVRDENSFHLIRNATGREPAVVLDPCLQFPEIAQIQPDTSASNYAVVYGHGFPAWLKRRIREWAQQRSLHLLSIGYLNDWADEQRISAGPIEFAKLMAGATAIVSNFFHGCVFAILNGKPWVSSPSAYRSIKIPDLVRLLGAEQRLIDDETSTATIGDLLGTPIQPSVASKIGELRQHSDAYLDAALN